MKRFFDLMAAPLFWRRVNLFLTFFWIALIPVSFATGWIKSVTFVSLLSMVALVLASQSSWQASRVEHAADRRDPETETVEKLTDIVKRDKDG